MSNIKIPVIKFLFREDLRSLREALNLSRLSDVQEFSTANDLASYLSTVSGGLILASMRDKSDLVQIATFVKISKKIAKNASFKIVVLNYSTQKSYEKALAKLGIQDQIEPMINTKALKFKLDYWMKSISVSFKTHSTQSQKTIKTNETKQTEKKVDTNVPNWTEPLQLEDDIWLIKQSSDCKKVLSKWLVRLLGPSPYVGTWGEARNGIWRFDIKPNEKELYVPNEGAWFFAGEQKPEFIWKENIWLMTGDSFELFFKSGDQITSRMKSINRQITIAKNSLFAKTKEKIIIQSFDKELVFKKEQESAGDLEGKGKTETIDFENLEGKNFAEEDLPEELRGKNKTEKLDYSDLVGKGGTDKINGGPLSGKTKKGADSSSRLEGKTAGGDVISYDDLDMEGDNSSEETHWDGSISDDDAYTDLEEGAKNDDLFEGNPLDLDGEKSNLKTYYKKHNNPEEFGTADLGAKDDEQREQRKNSYKEDPLGGHYGGKGGTDHLDSHYSQDENVDRGPETEGRSEKARRGQSATEKLSTHYGSPLDYAEKKKKQREKESGRPLTSEEKAEVEQKALREYAEAAALAKRKDKEAETGRPVSPEEKRSLDEEAASEIAALLIDKKAKEKSEELARPLTPTEKKDLEEKATENFLESLNTKRKEAPSKNLRDLEILGKDHKRQDQKNSAMDWYPETETGVGQSPLEDLEEQDDIVRKGDISIEEMNSLNSLQTKNDDARGRASVIDESFPRKISSKEDASYGGLGGEVVPLSKARAEREKNRTEEVAGLPLDPFEQKSLDELTSEAKVVAYLVQDNSRVSCTLDDFFEETIIFATENNSIKSKSKVQLDLMFSFLSKDTNLKLNGEVLSVDADGEGANFVTVQLSKENAAALETFLKLFQKKQANVAEFLKRAKGY